MAGRQGDLYGTEGSVPDAAGQSGSFGGGIGVRANADSFGGMEADALQKAGAETQHQGDQIEDFATKQAAIATEAKTNDSYASWYVPRAAALRNQYDQLQGQDKVHGYDTYIKGLAGLNDQFIGSSTSPYEKELKSKMAKSRITSEIFGAQTELARSQTDMTNRAATDKIQADIGYAAQNYNNPDVVNSVVEKNDATILMNHMDNGLDPTNPDHADTIVAAQNSVKGDMGISMINSALSRGDAPAANQIRDQFFQYMPGYKQLVVDHTLHVENMRQFGANASSALKSGAPIPPPLGAPAVQVQAAVANAAQSAGVDPSHALTVARIESSYGQNVGTRGDIGQTGKPGDINEQSSNMVTELKKSEDVARSTLGRQPDGWESYLCYQQGVGGGPKLLTSDPALNAVSALSPLYKSPQAALSAIVNNGGNASMSVSDYCNFIKQKYDSNAKRAAIEAPQGQTYTQPDPAATGGDTLLSQPAAPTIGDAITKPHDQGGETVQPSVTARQALNNFDDKYPAMMARAMQIPNLEQRAAVIKNLKGDRDDLSVASSAYVGQLRNQAAQLAVNPTFTSMDQVPPDMAATLLSDSPQTMTYLENRAKENSLTGAGAASHDMKTYGPEFFKLMKKMNSGEATDPHSEFADYLPDENGTPRGLTIAGYEKLLSLQAKDPETKAELEMRTQSFKVIKQQLSGEDEFMMLKDKVGDRLWSQALPMLDKALQEGKANKKTMGQLTDPTSPDWIGNAVKGLQRTPTQMSIDMQTDGTGLASSKSAPEQRTRAAIASEYNATQDPVKKAALRAEAVKLGYARAESGPSVPTE